MKQLLLGLILFFPIDVEAQLTIIMEQDHVDILEQKIWTSYKERFDSYISSYYYQDFKETIYTDERTKLYLFYNPLDKQYFSFPLGDLTTAKEFFYYLEILFKNKKESVIELESRKYKLTTGIPNRITILDYENGQILYIDGLELEIILNSLEKLK